MTAAKAAMKAIKASKAAMATMKAANAAKKAMIVMVANKQNFKDAPPVRNPQGEDEASDVSCRILNK